MQLPLELAASLGRQLGNDPRPGAPPLAFIDDEPFLLELQGSLDPPKGEDPDTTEHLGGMSAVRVGKLDFENPKKPILRIAHHRLEGKVEKLATPYALLRTRPKREDDACADDRPAKRARTSPPPSAESASSLQAGSGGAEKPAKRIEIVALIRHKLVFSKRPEPLIDVSSEADPTFETRKRAALESNKGVKGPRGAAAAAAAIMAGGKEGTDTPVVSAAVAAENGTGAGASTSKVSGANPDPMRKPANASKALSFFAPRRPAVAKTADKDAR
ncbi:hypothetical protein JCM3774_002817 [Rhodotorula dairenensis]